MLVLIVLVAAWLVFRAIGAAGVHVLASWQHSALYALAVMFVFTARGALPRPRLSLAISPPTFFQNFLRDESLVASIAVKSVNELL
jgi:hypothetical protein